MSTPKDTFLISLSAALLGVVPQAAATGFLIPNAAAQLLQNGFRRRDEEPDHALLLALPPRDDDPALLAYHRSHRSHSSHRSHYSGSGGGGGGSRRQYWPGPSSEPSHEAPAPKPRKLKPAVVSFIAFPGGHIFVDGKAVGVDSTRPLTLEPGKHSVRIENRFVGDVTIEVDLAEGQTGVVELKW